MSYKPNDFDTRFVAPVSKPAAEYERPITPELTETTEEQPVQVQAEVVEEKPFVQAEIVVEKPIVHLQPRAPTIEPVDVQAEVIEKKPIVHLEPRAPTIEPVDVQPDVTPIVIPSTKSEESIRLSETHLHGAPVDLPEVELVKPGPLPTLSIKKEKHKKPQESIKIEKTPKEPKVKKSTGGLCASCFGAKAAEKKKKETTSETAKAPIEQQKLEEGKTDDVSPTTPTIESSPIPTLSATTEEQTLEKSAEDLPKPDDRLGATIENLVLSEEPHYQLPSGEPVPLTPVENEYSLPEANTYDIPRTIETPSVENIQITAEEKTQITEVQKSSVEIISTEPKVESTIITQTETTPSVEVKEETKKKKSKTKKVKEPKVKEPKVKEKKVKEPKVKEPKVKEKKSERTES